MATNAAGRHYSLQSPAQSHSALVKGRGSKIGEEKETPWTWSGKETLQMRKATCCTAPTDKTTALRSMVTTPPRSSHLAARAKNALARGSRRGFFFQNKSFFGGLTRRPVAQTCWIAQVRCRALDDLSGSPRADQSPRSARSSR